MRSLADYVGDHLSATGACERSEGDESLCIDKGCTYCNLARAHDPDRNGRPLDQAGDTFRAGDHVHHKPSCEDWVLAADQWQGQVVCAGWPETIAKASDCVLVRLASEEERVEMLKRARSSGGGVRASWARDQLAEVE